MKKSYLIPVFCCIMLSACKLNQINPVFEETSIEYNEDKNNNILAQSDINEICDSLFYNIYECKDGSQIFELHFDYTNLYYIQYIPIKQLDGNYIFFTQLVPANDVTYHDDGMVEIPLSINGSESFQIVIKGRIVVNEGRLELNEKVITFLYDEDIKFNQEYSALDYDEKEVYRQSLTVDKNLSEQELEAFLRSCIYNGNMSVLEGLYDLMPMEESDSKYKLELALKHYKMHPLSEANPYKPEIFYGESYDLFPQKEILDVFAKSIQTGSSLELLGVRELESNIAWEDIWEIPNLQDCYKYMNKDDVTRALGLYKLDLDHDGLMEILMFSRGGSMGNEFWDLIYLDENGCITEIDSGDGMSSMSLYCFNDEYFFTSPIIDFNDKEIIGYYIYALDKDGNVFQAKICIDKIGIEIILSDMLIPINDSYYLDWRLDGFIDTYKRYEYRAIGNEFVPEKEIQELFGDLGGSEGYGRFDVNNDGIDDWTKVIMSLPSGRYPYYCNYIFIDGKTNKKLDFQKYFRKQNFNLRCMIPYQINKKNYFVCVGKGYGNYMIKLIEIRDDQPIEIHCWLVSVKNRILVQAFKEIERR